MNQPVETSLLDTVDAPAMSPLKRAFLALEQAHVRIGALEGAAREPIAVIGLACRVPGAPDAQAFWQLMRDGVDAIGPLPPSRWDADTYFDPDPQTPGRIATREGGFLGDVDRFDPAFFGIAPREAQGMDPQQRLVLEVAWEALEHAGRAPDRLERSATGVYLGACSTDYTYLQLKAGDPALLDAHFTSGIAHSVISGRVSYLLGLQGPSVTLDTACSSSLVAVHMAAQALRNGECAMALAGGVNLILSPDLYIALSHSRMLAPDGRCKTFSAAADGFGRGEGCGIVVLKRLSDAQKDGDRVLAVIRGSAVNQDGPSSGLTAPNGPAQEAVIRAALAQAGIAAGEVGYVEAHGTGTQLGDPLEVRALGAVFGAGRTQPLTIGSVKTNIGHLEAAAGVTGLIKLVLSLQHREIPPHLHFDAPSPHIPWDEFPLQVSTQRMPWPAIGGRRIAGVSSFGFSGTNAHVLVEEAPAPPQAEAAGARQVQVFTLSARDEAGLAEAARRHVEALQARRDDELADICFTANAGRAHLAQRASIVAGDLPTLREALAALSTGAPHAALRTHFLARRDPPRVAFMFTGQGAQYAGMGRGLYDSEPVFRAALDECAQLLRPHLERPLLDVMFAAPGETALLDETAYTQPALFAFEHALAQWWRSWGIEPVTVIGHSVGEIAAACSAGVLSLADALQLVAARGRLMQSLPAGGGMLALAATEADVAAAIEPHRASVSIAAVNGPLQTVISGRRTELERIGAQFAVRGVRVQPLSVSHAFHSPLVEPVLDRFERDVAGLTFAPPRLPLVSNLTGRIVRGADLQQPAYWRRHMREAVRFGDGLAALAQLKPDAVLEIGPHPTLCGFADAAWAGQGPLTIGSLRKGRDDAQAAAEAIASLYLAGARLEWRTARPGRVVSLPTAVFQRERLWFQAQRPTPGPSGRPRGHPLLGARLRSAAAQIVYESHVGADAPAYMREHRVLGQVIVPATAYLDTLLAAARDQLKTAQVAAEDVEIDAAMLLDEGGARRRLQLVSEPPAGGSASVALFSQPVDADESQPWTRHVAARLRGIAAEPPPAPDSLTQARARCTDALAPEAFYADFERRGLAFGPAFRSIRSMCRGADEAVGEVELHASLQRDASAHGIHPVLLDGCLQVLAGALGAAAQGQLYLPIAIGRFALFAAAPLRCWSHVQVRSLSGESASADVRVHADDGTPLAALTDVRLKRVSRDALARLGERWLDDCLYETEWQVAPQQAPRDADVAVRDLVAAGEAALDRLRAEAGIDAYDRFLPRFEALCVDYVVQACRQLGWAPRVGESFETHELAAALTLQPRHERLFGRLLAILAEAGFLARDHGRWQLVRALPAVDPQSAWRQLRDEYPQSEAELEMTGRVAPALAQALRGEVEAMQLLFPGGSLDTAERMYRDSPTARLYNGTIAEVLAAALRGRAPGATPLRVLEIGAGTGGTTAHLLPNLPKQGVEYVFTDVGPLFVARACERFGSHPAMRFEVLDLERDPLAQGFAPQAFDIVIASNVIHATARLRDTLARVRTVLREGGLLLMLEVTAPQRWFDLTVGLTEGWWAFADADLRTDYATLPRERWLALLGECGFADAAALAGGPADTGALALQSVLLARAGTSTAAMGTGPWLVFADAAGVAEPLVQRLREKGAAVSVVRPGRGFAEGASGFEIDPASPADLRRLLGTLVERGEPPAQVLFAWPADAGRWAEQSIEGLGRSTVTGPVGAVLLAQALLACRPVPRLGLLTRGAQQVGGEDAGLDPAQATVWGVAKAIVLEHPELGCTCIDLDDAAGAAAIDGLLAEFARPSDAAALAWRRGERHHARLVRTRRAVTPPARPAAYRLAGGRSFDELVLAPAARRMPGPGEVEIAVEASGLNFKDVLNALGMYPGDPGPLGGECAGRVVAVGTGVARVRPGDRVLAVAGGSLASHVLAREAFVQALPEGASAEDGATFAIPFLTAEFCLGHLAQMKRGDTVLIHAAAGGVGMAAVRLAQRAGARIVATAGAPWKRELLHALGVADVLDSRSTRFADEVLQRTGGRGVDIVLNSLAGDTIDASLRALADGGCFVEIGKRDIKSAAQVEALGRRLRYHVVDWGETGEGDPALIGAMLARLVAAWRAGELAPLPRHAFAIDDAQRAFRFMAQARHAGKVVLRHAPPATTIRRDGSYLVTGGLDGLGAEFARWLARRGAGRLVLVSRRGPTAASAPLLDELRALGSAVVAEALDVGDAAGLAALLDRVRRDGPPLRGVFHSAGVLDDAGLLQQDAQRFAKVFGPKVRGGWLLDRLTRGDPLDLFVLFSSAAAVLGSRGQANHAAANAFLDLLARERRSRGLPGLSINWGAWGEIGAAASPEVRERLAAQGIGQLSPQQGVLAFERLLEADATQVAVMQVDWPRYLAQLGGPVPDFLDGIAGLPAAAATPSAPSTGREAQDLLAAVLAAPVARRRPLVAAFARERALHALGLDATRSVDPRLPLGDLGLDSLLAVELRNSLGKALGRTLPATLLFDHPTLDALTDRLLAEITGEADAPAASASADDEPAAVGDLVDAIDNLSDEEVDRLLAQRAARSESTT